MPDISQLQKVTHEKIFSSPEFLGEKKPPEVVALIPKSNKERKVSPSKFDSFGKRRFQISSLIENFDAETASIYSRQSSDSKTGSISTRNSINSALECFNFVDDEFSDLDEKVFSGSKSKSAKTSDEVFNQLFGIHNFEDIEMQKNQSISSLRSLSSLPGFFNFGSGMKKWSNLEDLDDISLMSLDPKNKWVVGDTSDTGMFLLVINVSFNAISVLVKSINQLSKNISPSLVSETSCQDFTTEPIKTEEKSFGSTDSGIAQENHVDIQTESEINRSITPPPPPPVFDEEVDEVVENVIPPPIINESKEIEKTVSPQEEDKLIGANTFVESKRKPTKEAIKEPKKVPIEQCAKEVIRKPVSEPISLPVKQQVIEPGVLKDAKNTEISDIDWQYQLPSPPKAFKDSSPANFADVGNSESRSITDFKDSVVTSPELFEKLKAIEDSQSDKGTVTSDITSVVSEEEKPLLNTLSLENLERRKSLVYNRELATSLKMTDTVDTNNFQAETFSSSLTQFESTYDEIRKSSLPKETVQPKHQKTNAFTHTLPNFKISTYDQPKQKIKVFEDDTIRSNTENYNKAKTLVETSTLSTTMSNSYVGKSMENISMRKSSLDNESSHSSEEKDYKFYRPTKTAMPRSFGPISAVFRSESFSTENCWSPSKPVSRSKSHLTLNSNKYREEKLDTRKEESMSRSNSLFDVSGLQSLEVMKLIQNKLNTPTSSMENLNQKERTQKTITKQELKHQIITKSVPKEEPQKPPTPEKNV
ncbi:hypothetical protein NQ314_018087 [Rhamnusium bicolor]|uniref:Uncharacterized protein n=1 Tax=Rhamnusium bicolor TaxID=1586634 RepID=A0AAV8WS05_9CUCU|nr:hypothetical protein NQ314_018087 [Rhamnusium bicolor]